MKILLYNISIRYLKGKALIKCIQKFSFFRFVTFIINKYSKNKVEKFVIFEEMTYFYIWENS